jgi:DNA-binding beta-propeller fold protein YncE
LIGPKIHVGTAPNGIAVTPDGRDVYVVNRAEAFVSIIGVASNTVTSLPGFNGPIMWGKFIGPASSVITLESSLNPSLLGQSVTFTATVNGGTPTGSITFSDGSNPLGSVTLLNSGTTGTATLSAANLTGGDHLISATYAGNAYSLSATASLHQVVNTAVANRPVMAPTLGQWNLFLLAVLVACGAAVGKKGEKHKR